jgi:hypothetical protein
MENGIDYSKMNFRKKNPPASLLRVQGLEERINALHDLNKILAKQIKDLSKKVAEQEKTLALKTQQAKPTTKK